VRTVDGTADRVVVVGAGLAGLSAALRLVASGRTVIVLERAEVPGGRAGVHRDRGYVFDTGPTVLTMPELLEDAFACVGERLTDHLDLLPLDPLYRARFGDGSVLDVRPGVDGTADAIATTCGQREADGYRRFAAWVSALYRAQVRDFIDRNLDSPLDLLTPNLARIAALGGFRRLAPRVRRFLRDPRTQRVFSFQALYAGVSPARALALYAVIAYMDTVAGVWFPRGGLHAVPVALAAAAARHGVDIRYHTEVTRVELCGDRAVAVHTGAGDRVAADAVVLTPDLPVAARTLLGRPLRRRLRFSPSCFLLLAGTRGLPPPDAHHTIHFGHAWERTFDELLRERRLMSDPSLLVTTPTRSDPTLAPAGGHAHYVLAPTPNLDAPIDWPRIGPRYRDELVAHLERLGYVGFGRAVEVERTVTPADWAAAGMERGTPFAAAHTFAQTGPFRPRNLARGLANVVYAGSGTIPGVGVPMVLLSGRLAAERITGPDPAYRSRAWPGSSGR
jgi:phytoene desaturase